jgi:hypothetical protein
MAQGGKLKIIIIIILLLIPFSSFASDRNTGLHLGLSSIFGAASESYFHYKTNIGTTERIIYATTLGSVPGLAKEVLDSRKEDNHFSGSDMAANVAGAFIGSVIANFINNRIHISVDKQRKKATVFLSYSF